MLSHSRTILFFNFIAALKDYLGENYLLSRFDVFYSECAVRCLVSALRRARCVRAEPSEHDNP